MNFEMDPLRKSLLAPLTSERFNFEVNGGYVLVQIASATELLVAIFTST
jgi:hypothetical protein